MIRNLTHSDNYLKYLTLRGKQKRTKKKLKHTRRQNSSPFFKWSKQKWDLFTFPSPNSNSPLTSHQHEFYGATSGFTMLIMKTTYVCHNLISPCVNFHNNRTMRSIFASGGGEEKEHKNEIQRLVKVKKSQ